jgi:dTDP-4-dehydrorhamnose reductase
MLRLAREREILRVVADQRGCPTSAHDLAHAIRDLAGRAARGEALVWGTYHLTGAGETSWHDFAAAILDRLEREEGWRPVLQPITTAEFPTPARRPARSTLDCGRIGRTFGIAPRPWRDGLERTLDEIWADRRRTAP